MGHVPVYAVVQNFLTLSIQLQSYLFFLFEMMNLMQFRLIYDLSLVRVQSQ